MTRKVVITNVFGSFNRGDALLVETLHSEILAAFGPDIAIEGVAHFPELEREHLPAVKWHRPPGRSYAANKGRRRMENILNTVGVGLYALLGAPRWAGWLAPAEQASAIRAIRDADIAVSCAGGFLLDANISIWGALLQIAAAHRFGTPMVIAPQTIGPIRSKLARRATTWALSRCRVVCAREGYTYAFLQELGVPSHLVVRTTDLALFHDRVDPQAGQAALRNLGIAEGEAFMGASVVDWSFPGTADRAARRQAYEDKVCQVIETIHKRLGLRTFLVNQVSSDLPLARRVAARLPSQVILDDADRTTAEMRGIIRNADIFFGSRFHSCVFSLLERVPTLSLAYTYKSTGIMEDLGLAARVFDIDSFKVDQVVDQLVDMHSNRNAEQATIATALDNIDFPKFSDILTGAAG